MVISASFGRRLILYSSPRLHHSVLGSANAHGKPQRRRLSVANELGREVCYMVEGLAPRFA
jgi:hypothetical protein